MDMKALVIEKPGTASVKTVPVPRVGDNDVLIKVKASGICGSDVHFFRNEGTFCAYPIIPGHEFSGVVKETGGKVTRFKKGDRVAVEPNIACNNCPPCLNNRQNYCENWNAFGVTLPGGMAEYTVVPESAAFDIGDLPFTHGALVEPLSCVIHGVERARVKLGDKVLVIGAGPIGILLSKTIQLQGAEITQIDKNKSRLELAKQSGATHVFSSLDEAAKEAYDVVVDASGVTALMEQTIYFVRKSGTVLLFGVPKRDAIMKIPAQFIFEREVSLVTTNTSVRNSIQAVRLLQSGTLDASAMISHQLPLEDFVKGVETIEQGTEGVLKVIICPEK